VLELYKDRQVNALTNTPSKCFENEIRKSRTLGASPPIINSENNFIISSASRYSYRDELLKGTSNNSVWNDNAGVFFRNEASKTEFNPESLGAN
jgi:hypothetical protein